MSVDLCPRCHGLIGRCRCVVPDLPVTAFRHPVTDDTGPRDDIASGEVWPDATDPEYVDWLAGRVAFLEQRCRDYQAQLDKAEELLERYEGWGTAALAGLDDVVARLIAEEHGPPPKTPPKARKAP